MEKAIIFDMDGTLLKTETILEKSLNLTLKKLDKHEINYTHNPIDQILLISLSMKRMFRLFL